MAAHPLWISKGSEEIGLSKYEKSPAGKAVCFRIAFHTRKRGPLSRPHRQAVIFARKFAASCLVRNPRFFAFFHPSITVRWEFEPGVTAAELSLSSRLRPIFPPRRTAHKDLGIRKRSCSERLGGKVAPLVKFRSGIPKKRNCPCWPQNLRVFGFLCFSILQ